MSNDETGGPPSGMSMLRVQIGPVQDFIAAARTARDLWSGSYLLSWLMAAAVKAVQEAPGAELIFPMADTDKLHICGAYASGRITQEALDPCLTNKLTAFAPTEQAEQVAQAARQAVQQEWNRIATRVWNMLPTPLREDTARRARYDSQVRRHLSVEYAHLPMDMPPERMREMASGMQEGENEDEKIALAQALKKLETDKGARYAAMYHLLDHYLDSVRKVRGFEAWNAGCGRDAGWYAARDLAKDSLTGKEEQILRYKQDRLLLENWDGKYKRAFARYQTDIIGAVTLIKRLWYLDIMDCPDGALPDFNADSGPNDNGGSDDENHYYAVLAMDGDRIGKALTRHPVFDVDKTYHGEFSTALANFAQNRAGRIVENHGGMLIYAGGDDVLALLPLNEALNCANELQQAFRAEMAGVKPDMTVSAGLAFAHSKAPLQDAVRAASTAESRAKKELDRGAFFIRLMKRSGEIAEWGAKWDSGAVELLDAWKRCLEAEAISAKGAHRLAELLTPYLSHPVDTVQYEHDEEFRRQEEKVAMFEFESMLMRQWQKEHGTKEMKSGLRTCMLRYIDHLNKSKQSKQSKPDTLAETLADTLVPMCSVIAFYGKKTNQKRQEENT